MSRFSETLERLNATIASRVGADPASSYTAKLLVNEIKTQALEPGYSAQDFASAGLSFAVPADKVICFTRLQKYVNFSVAVFVFIALHYY